MKALFVIGRVVFGGFFLWSGISHFKEKESQTRYAEAKGLPQPDAAVLASGVAMAAGGASIILGVKPQLGALAILGFLAIASPTMHDFWNADEQQRGNELAHFSKNIALLGAALALAGIEKWPVSITE